MIVEAERKSREVSLLPATETYSGYGNNYRIGFDFGGTESPKKIETKEKDYLHEEDFEDDDLDTIAPGTYIEIIRVHPIYMEEGLFGWCYPEGSPVAYVKGDMKGLPYRKVRAHEVDHHARRSNEQEARDRTGTHMEEFLPLYRKMKLCC